MVLKYWEYMAQKEKEFSDSVPQENLIEIIPSDQLKEDITEMLSAEDASGTDALKGGSAAEDASGKDALKAGSPVKNGSEGLSSLKEEQKDDGPKEAYDQKKKLPRPLAVIFGTLLILVSLLGISILTAFMFVIALFSAIIAAALIGGGGFLIYEGIINIYSGTLVSIQSAGVGLAAIALGLIFVLAAIKSGFRLLPKTAGFYPKAIGCAVEL